MIVWRVKHAVIWMTGSAFSWKVLRMLKAILDAAGVELVAKWRIPRASQTAYLSRLLRTLGVDCVLDVGANIGQYREYLRSHVGFKGPIISFEPHPECLAVCRQSMSSDSLWHVMPYALGAQAGKMDFHLTKDSQFSSFLEPENSATPQFESTNKVDRTVTVDVVPLDDVLPGLMRQLRVGRPFLKLDTQGFDLEVLKGASSSLSSIPALQTEISNLPIYKNISSMEAAFRQLREWGWQLGCMFPTNPEQFPVSVDFDTYFLRFDPR
ncbi:MAG: FkbM family methyltransferase [Betaproteobacteria bacterium]|nr:FkbM family methyltransferase [Betaproteobacteria bacterium]